MVRFVVCTISITLFKKHELHYYMDWSPSYLGFWHMLLTDFRFSAFNFIFNMQKNAVSALAAHFPHIKDDSQNFIYHISLCNSFYCLVGKNYKLLPHFITKCFPPTVAGPSAFFCLLHEFTSIYNFVTGLIG